MPFYICHFTCNPAAWPDDRERETAIWKDLVGEGRDLTQGGPVKFNGWISNTEGYSLLEADSKAEVIRICAEFWPYFNNDICEIVPIAEAGPALVAGSTAGLKKR